MILSKITMGVAGGDWGDGALGVEGRRDALIMHVFADICRKT